MVLSKMGMTRKKARFRFKPERLESQTQQFIQQRNLYLEEGRTFVSIDETSFGRYVAPVTGYAPRGQPLYADAVSPRDPSKNQFHAWVGNEWQTMNFSQDMTLPRMFASLGWKQGEALAKTMHILLHKMNPIQRTSLI
jgi:hypothetical protein